MLPRTYIYGIIMFGFFMLCGMTIFTHLNNEYSDFADAEKLESFNNTFNNYNKINETVSNIESEVINTEEDFGVLGGLNALITTSWQTLKLLTQTLSFMSSTIRGLTSYFGIPAFIVSTIIFLITVTIIFAIKSGIFQKDM